MLDSVPKPENDAELSSRLPERRIAHGKSDLGQTCKIAERQILVEILFNRRDRYRKPPGVIPGRFAAFWSQCESENVAAPDGPFQRC